MSNDSTQSSNTTKIVFAAEARKQLFAGMSIAAEAVGATLGPKGKTVLIQQENGSPIVTKDGVTVSKSIRLKDPIERMGAELIREAASQTNDVAGDGTTTSTVLTHALIKEGLKLLEAGYSAKELCEGIEKAHDIVAGNLIASAKQLTTWVEIAQVGTISANGDEAIGKLIADAMEKVGKDGIITVEDAKGMSTTLSIAEGMQFERGYLSPYFVTNPERMNAVYQDAVVLVTDKKLSNLRDLVPVLEYVMQQHSPLLIIAEDVDGDALQGLVLNRVKSNLPIVAIKAPGYGQHKTDILNDICTLTGATLVSSATGTSLDKAHQCLGKIKKFIVDAKLTTIVGTGTTKESIDKHVEELRIQLQDITLSTEEIQKLKVRIARLANGVAIIRVGGATEVEMVERKYRIEDALNATKAAADEGIVPGGGMALMNAIKNCKFDDQDTQRAIGMSIVVEACKAPLRRIVQNSGLSADVVFNELGKCNLGYNAATGKYVDLIADGIVDPVKVTRFALKNAVSVATTFLSLDAVVYND